MNKDSRFNISFTLILSTIMSVFIFTGICFLIFLMMAFGMDLIDLFSSIEGIFILSIVLIGVFYFLVHIYLLIEHFKNKKFHSNLFLFIAIMNIFNIPLGTILGIFMLIFRNDILKLEKKK